MGKDRAEKALKIGFFSQHFFPEQFSNNLLASKLVEGGHDVTVFPCVPNYGGADFYAGFSNSERRTEIWNGVNIMRVLTIARGTSKTRLALNYLSYPLSALWTYALSHVPRPDVTFVSLSSPIFQALPAIALKKIFGVPTVYWVQDVWPESLTLTLGIKSKAALKVLEVVCGWIYRQADLVLVQNDGFKPLIARFGVESFKLETLPNTAPAHFRPVKRIGRENLSPKIPRDSFVVMFAGNIGEAQDFETVVDAASRVDANDRIHWVIVGSGRGMKAAQDLVLQRGLSDVFHFLGRHPEDAMPQMFSEADVMLVSLRDTPLFAMTIPFKVQCYMACGRPILANLAGQGAKLVEAASAGLTSPPGDAGALAACVLKLKSMGVETRERLGLNGRAYFEANFNQEKVIAILEQALLRVARKST